MDEIVTNSVASECPVAAGVDGTHVAGFQGNVVNLIELDQMFIAAKENGTMRVVVDQVM